jgi:predicted nicotinamide N-methyase
MMGQQRTQLAAEVKGSPAVCDTGGQMPGANRAPISYGLPMMLDPPAFIRANTRLLAPPLVPEILLHLAEESVPIWQKTEEELGEMNVPPPYWAFAWAGGQALARYILDNAGLFAGRRVLDLGAGSGLTAIAAMKTGAANVLANDIDAVALAAVALNAAVNGVSVDTTAADLLAAPPARFDVILVGDLFYERALAERVLAFITRAADGGALILIGDPQRTYFPGGRFTLAAEYQVAVTRELEDALIKRTAVWRL